MTNIHARRPRYVESEWLKQHELARPEREVLEEQPQALMSSTAEVSEDNCDTPAAQAEPRASMESLIALRVAAEQVFEGMSRKGYKPFVLCAAIDTATQLTLAFRAVDAKPSERELRSVLMNAAARAAERTSHARAERSRKSLLEREVRVVTFGAVRTGSMPATP
jgi:hypothetical protein